jgi:hypothetical protein
MDLELHPVILFDHNNVPWKFIVWRLMAVLRGTVEPVFTGVEHGQKQLGFGTGAFSGDLNHSVNGRPLSRTEIQPSVRNIVIWN